jgi:hypothetical protein
MEASHPKYQPGQVWKYHTRPAETGSRATILRVDLTPSQGYVVHVALDGLTIKSPQSSDGMAKTISHLPFSEAAIDKSVTELDHIGPVPEYREGYQTWRDAFDHHKAGVWTVSVADAVTAMESILSGSK